LFFQTGSSYMWICQHSKRTHYRLPSQLEWGYYWLLKLAMSIVIESSFCFWKYSRNSGQFLFYNCLPEILSLLLDPHIHLLLGAYEVSGVVAASYWHSWWRWWSDPFWVTLTRLWPHSFLVFFFWFDCMCTYGYCQSLFWSLFCHLIDVLSYCLVKSGDLGLFSFVATGN
jgi:hypothetical protein